MDGIESDQPERADPSDGVVGVVSGRADTFGLWGGEQVRVEEEVRLLGVEPLGIDARFEVPTAACS